MNSIASHITQWGLLDAAEAERRLGLGIQLLPAGAVVLDATNRLVYLNPAAAQVLGQPAAVLLGRPLSELLADDADKLRRQLHAAQAGASEPLRLTVGKAGQRRSLLASPRMIEAADGSWLLLVCQDISEEIAAQDRLARQAASWGQRNVHLALLQRPTLDIAAQPELEATLQAIVYRAARLIDADGSVIFLLDEQGQELVRSASWGSGTAFDGLTLSPTQGVAAEALRGAISRRYTDASLLDQHGGPALRGPLITVPLQYRETISGLLAVFRSPTTARQHFSQDDELLLEAISAQAALAIGNARLYDSTRDSLAQLETMTELLEAINSQLELQPLLDRIIEGAARLFDAEVGVISLCNTQGSEAQIVASYDLPELLGIWIQPGGIGVSGQVLLSGEPVIVNDTYRSVPGSELLHRPVDHALGAPIRWQGRMLGVFMIGSLSRRFGERDIQPLALFAKHAAIAIEKARLFDETRSLAGALRTSETRLRAIIDNMPALVYLADPEQGILLANQNFADLVGYPNVEALIGKKTPDLFPAEEAAIFDVNNRKVLNEQAKIVVEEASTHNGELHHFLSIKFPVRDQASGAIQLGGVAVDITERKQNEERLRQLAALEERQNLARELHDSVTQTLFSMSLNARAAERALANNPQQTASVVAELRRLAQGALAEMRALIFELRPESLENEGLLAALAKHSAALTARHEIAVESEVDVEPAIDISAKEALYRIAQEAMHNVVKHADAAIIRLRMAHEQHANGHRFVMQIADDGKGFDPDARYAGHLGLVSMRERAARSGAAVSIASRIGAGTTVTVSIPVPAEPAEHVSV